MKKLSVLAACTLWVPLSSYADKPIFELTNAPLEYEMSLGEIDLFCTNPDFNDSYDQQAKVINATLEIGDAGALSTDPETFKLLKVTTNQIWAGIINANDGSATFENKRLIDITKDDGQQYGLLDTIHLTTHAKGKYTDGTIDGTVNLKIHLFSWLSEIESCSGTGSLTMTPK